MILHQCSDYADRPLYGNLVQALDRRGVDQIVYVPARRPDQIGKNSRSDLERTRFVFTRIVTRYRRLNYLAKIAAIHEDVEAKVDVRAVDLIHAHFLFSDGGVARRLHLRWGMPYIVTVQNTDLNLFFKYMLHLRRLGVRILRDAARVVFISAPYAERVLQQHVPPSLRDAIRAKSAILPFGVDDFWLANRTAKREAPGRPLRLLFVGVFNRNKNVDVVIELAQRLNARLPTRLVLAGGGGTRHEKIVALARSAGDLVRYVGRVEDRERLLRLYREADILIMASTRESFGLVYGEAMSQGTPVIYTRGQGFDRQFEDGHVGFAVAPGDVVELERRVDAILADYRRISANCTREVERFRWESVATSYAGLYRTALAGGSAERPGGG